MIYHTNYVLWSLLMSGLIFGTIAPVAGWGNESYADNVVSYDYSENFGTHDWVANAALNELNENNSSNWAWLVFRRTIYLVGTEAPDNSDLSVTLNGESYSGFGDTTSHHIYFNEDGSIKDNEDDAAVRAKWCADWADVKIGENKLDAAAFYLGAMSHYIADMSMYAHVAPNNVAPHNLNFDEYHSEVEGYVNSRTNDYYDLEDFFQINPETIVPTPAYDVAKSLAWDTYKDPTPSESTTRDAVWLHQNFFSPWELAYSSRDDDTTNHQLYYNRIEENLNAAITAIAAALSYVSNSPVNTNSSDSNTPPTTTLPPVIDGYLFSGIIISFTIATWILYRRYRFAKLL